ncbi:MAG: GNAT family N-acetyltransferase [Chloroflexi bacterium]|nr:GNAT family N-acetyltransferase [Chloroflexota bacterium]
MTHAAPAVEVRVARPSEFAAIGNLTARVYIDEHFSPASADATLRDSKGRASAAAVLLVAVTPAGEVAGTVTFIPKASALAQVRRDSEAEFRLLAVAPDLRGAGIGEALVTECIARARKAHLHAVVLSTQESMLAAHRLYERLGFVREPHRDWERNNGRRMLVYRLALT